MKKFLKSVVVIFICLFIIFSAISPCVADEEFQHYVVADENYIIETFFSNYDFENLSDEFISAIRSHVANYPDEIQILYLNSTGLRIQCCRNDTYLQDLKFSLSDDSALYGCFCVDFNYHSFENNFRYSMNASQRWYQVASDYLTCTNESSLASYIYNMSASYKNSTNSSSYRPFWQTSYYDNNILQAILDYYDDVCGVQQLYDVSHVGENFLLFYDCFESYKGKYNYEFFQDRFLNYLYGSVTFDDDIYYTSDVDTGSSGNTNYQHKERLAFYIKINDEDNSDISYRLNAQDAPEMSDTDIQNWIIQYLNDNTECKHYENGVINFSSWYSHINTYWFNGTAKLSLHKVVTNTFASSIVDGKQYYIKFYMPNSYTYIESDSNSIFMGSRTASNAVLFDPLSGQRITGNGGVGSRLDEADLGVLKSKEDLLNHGWKNGYPNTTGSYPYYIKMTCNGEEFLYFYFKEKPNVESYYYTDSQIKYTVDINKMVGYVYQPAYNISNQFNFSDSKLRDLSVAGFSLNQIANAVDTGVDVVTLVGSASSPALSIVSFFYDIFQVWAGYQIDVLNSAQNLNVVLWTNYTGSKADGLGNIRGYYVQFNWNVDGDRSFLRDNSDDNHDYSEDVIQDIPTTQEIPTEVTTDASGNIVNSYNNYTYNYYYADNNGNIHGGGDLTYVATEPPTHLSELSFNGNGYDFDTDLLNVSSNYLDFLKSALSFFPAWIWSLVGLGLTVVIFLRILGR